MNIKYQDIITLSDGFTYIVASIVKYNDSNYIYLVDIHNTENIKIGKIEYNYISILNKKDNDLICKLIPLLYNRSKNDVFYT